MRLHIATIFIICLSAPVVASPQTQAPTPAQAAKFRYAATTREGYYELQDRCGKRSDELFKRAYGVYGVTNTKDGQALAGYRNHYNKKLNKCFFLLTYEDVPKNYKVATSTLMTLTDINENREYGSFFIRFFDKMPIYCKVLDKVCRSEQEWNALVSPYMEE